VDVEGGIRDHERGDVADLLALRKRPQLVLYRDVNAAPMERRTKVILTGQWKENSSNIEQANSFIAYTCAVRHPPPMRIAAGIQDSSSDGCRPSTFGRKMMFETIFWATNAPFVILILFPFGRFAMRLPLRFAAQVIVFILAPAQRGPHARARGYGSEREKSGEGAAIHARK